MGPLGCIRATCVSEGCTARQESPGITHTAPSTWTKVRCFLFERIPHSGDQLPSRKRWGSFEETTKLQPFRSVRRGTVHVITILFSTPAVAVRSLPGEASRATSVWECVPACVCQLQHRPQPWSLAQAQLVHAPCVHTSPALPCPSGVCVCTDVTETQCTW